MTTRDLALLEKLWARLVGDGFLMRLLAEQIRKDGGHDVSDLSDEELIQLIEGRFSGDWREPAFAFGETLAFYVAMGSEMKPQQVLGWVCSALIIRDAVRKNAADWDMVSNNLIKGFLVVRNQLHTEECVEILSSIFGPDTTNVCLGKV
jgi:hypothetical protein